VVKIPQPIGRLPGVSGRVDAQPELDMRHRTGPSFQVLFNSALAAPEAALMKIR
jgi:hypothetical protein